MMTAEFSCVRGRFAPSPSGPLHFGSLIAAVGSYLSAKSQQGQWLLRIEDIDTPRTVPGAADHILRTLEQFGLHWDGPVVWQSQRLALYQHYFDQFADAGLLYPCTCNRARISSLGGLYDGHCRAQNHNQPEGPCAWRLASHQVDCQFRDAVFGVQHITPAQAGEDYIVKRRDGLFAYQWVVVIDDWQQQISEVVRGADLLSMTPRQQALFRQLGAPVPAFAHLPLAVSAPGHKLSKQNHATDISRFAPAVSLSAALRHLGQPLPPDSQQLTVGELLAFALAHWQLAAVPAQTEMITAAFV
jgi:glutamyl-Q tRNA(Asp) synthetase